MLKKLRLLPRPAGSPAEGILRREEIVAGSPQADDLTLVVARVK